MGEVGDNRRGLGNSRGRVTKFAFVALTLTVAIWVAAWTLANTTVDGKASPAVTPDETELTQLVTNYWEGVENNDNALVAAQLCPDDREMYEQESDPEAVPVDPRIDVTVNIAEIRMAEPYAAIRQTPSFSTMEDTIYAQRVDGRWLICVEAEDLMTEAESGTPAPPTD